MKYNQFRHLFSKVPWAPQIYHWLKKKYKKPYLNARVVPGIYGRVHEHDFMIARSSEGVKVYNQIGQEALQLLEQSVILGGTEFNQIRKILDFGCGYGRVTRQLVKKTDPKRISVFDVDPVAPAFCAHEFGVHPLTFRNNWNWSRVLFGSYDLIWVGSVFTHLSLDYAIETLKILKSILAPSGLMVFTTHDVDSLPKLYEGFYGDAMKKMADKVEIQLLRDGFCFIPYSSEELEILPFDFQRKLDFGMTWIRREFMEKLIAQLDSAPLTLLKYMANGWGGHQAVFMYQKS